MASVGHVAVGVLLGRVHGGKTKKQTVAAMVCLGAAAMLPDADMLALTLGAHDHGMIGHRGWSHSLLTALAFSLGAGLLARKLFGLRCLFSALFFFVAMASHGIMDAMTADSRGIPLFWPITEQRFSFPWRPIPVPPSGFSFFGRRGLEVATIEIIYFFPILIVTFWPRWKQRLQDAFAQGGLRLGMAVGLTALCLTSAHLYLRDTKLVARLEKPSRFQKHASVLPRHQIPSSYTRPKKNQTAID